MGLLQRIWNRSADTSWVGGPQADASFEAWVAQQGTDFLPPNTNGWPVAEIGPDLRAIIAGGNQSYAGIYRSQPAVYTVVEFLSWQISQLGLKTYRRVSDDDREEVHEHPVARLIRHPAPGLTYARFLQRTVSDFYIYGNAFWVMLRSPEGRDYVVPVPPANVQPRGGTLIEAGSFDISISGAPKSFPAEQVVHFRRNNPEDGRIGLSPLEPLRAVIREEYEASRYRQVMFTKDARMSGFVKRDKEAPPLDEDGRERLRTALQTFSKGGRNEGSWMVLEDGDTPVPISFSPREAEFLEGRKFTLETVCRALNVPLPVMGLSETATYASQREHHKALYQDTLAPITRDFEDEIAMKVIPWVTGDADNRAGLYVEFNIEEKLRGAFEDQADLLQRATGGPYMTRNEARARLNLDRIDDPDVDELVVTNNMVGNEADQADAAAAPIMQLAPASQGGQR